MSRALILVAVSLILSVACDDPPPPEATAALGSRMELAAGDVFLASGGAKKRLITGAMLPEKAALEVGPGGRALVRLGTGAGAFLRGGTDATIDGGTLVLGKGELWADVPGGEQEMGRFEAGGVTVSASDAGLDIAIVKEGVRVYVARGLAVVSGPGGRVEVQSGERVTIKGKAKPETEPVDFWEDWTGGMADRGLLAGMGGKAAGRIYGIDRSRPGARPEELQILAQEVRITVRDGIAHTEVDQRFFNPSSTPLEGWYWFTVPEGASVSRFALEVNGALVDGEMIERKQAAAAYEEAVRKAFDPALLEWVDATTFRARIYPIPAAGERRVVLSYFELLPLADGVYRYVYPLAAGGEGIIQEFSLNVDLGADGEKYRVATLQDARVEQDGSKISMRRSGFRPATDFLLELEPTEEAEPLRALRFDAGEKEADYIMLRYAPAVSWDELDKVPGDVVVVLDTSAGGDDSDRQVRADAVEAILRAMSDGDRFAVVATDLKPQVVYPAEGLAPADEKNVSAAVEKLSEISTAGATDLGEMFSAALDLLHDAQQPAVVYVGDGNATVGETSSKKLADRLRRALGDSRARLFTLAVGDDANLPLLERLARVGGGRSFTVATAEQTVQEALRFVGHVKTPTITDLEIDAGSGLDQLFVTAAGKLSEGDEVVLLARTHHALPAQVKITGLLGGKKMVETYDLDVDEGTEHGYIPILWARHYLKRLMEDDLEGNRGRIISLGLSYALMTPFSSFLVLESDDAYRQQGIMRKNRHRFSARHEEEGERLAMNAPIPLLGLFGCASGDEAPEAEMLALQEKLAELKTTAEPMSSPSPSPAPPPVASAPAEPAAELDDLLAAAKKSASKSSSKRRASRPRKKKGGLSDDPLSGFDLGGGGDADGEASGRLGTGAGKARDKKEEGRGTFRRLNPYGDDDGSRPAFKTDVCSDASRRPLSQRRILWARRLARAGTADLKARVFFEAGARCELPSWRDRKSLLDMIESRARTPEAVRGLMNAFAGRAKIARYLRRRILKRTLDPNVTMGLHFPDAVNWGAVVAGLAALKTDEARLEKVRAILAKNPTDPVGRGLLVKLLVHVGEDEEALAEATRLRRDGLVGPEVLELLCDLQAAAEMVDEARRTCSELVEFNPSEPGARRRLGDIFLRHGWYGEAYRQYASLAEMVGDTPAALLRLAAAAAGMGKVDEALRIERKVASGDGEPGPRDPRRWARLLSAVRLARMLIAARGEKKTTTVRALERSLKRTQLFGAQATLALLVWEDYDATLGLTPVKDDEPFPVSERLEAVETGLSMVDLGRAGIEGVELEVKRQGEAPARPVRYTLITIGWDGKKFTIAEREAVAVSEPEAV